MAPYQSILSQIQLPNLGAVDFSGLSTGYIQGRQMAIQQKQFDRKQKNEEAQQEWLNKQFEDKIAKEQAEKEAQKLEVQKQILEQTRIQEMNKAQNAFNDLQTGKIDNPTFASLYKESEQRYRYAAKKLGTDAVDEFAFPDITSFAGQQEGAVPTPQFSQPTQFAPQAGGQLPAGEAPAPIAGTAAQPTFMQQLGQAQAPGVGKFAEGEAQPTAIEKLAATLMAASTGEQSFADARYARQSNLFPVFFKKAQEMEAADAAARGTKVYNFTGEPGFKKESQSEIKQGIDQLGLLDQAMGTIGGKFNPSTGKIEGGKFEELFGAFPRAQKWFYDQKSDTAGILPDFVTSFTPEQRDRYDRMLDVRKTIGNIRLEEFHRLFGSAQTDNEIKQAVGRILDENASPMEVQNALENLYTKTYNANEIRLQLLKENAFDEKDVGTVAWSNAFERLRIEREKQSVQGGFSLLDKMGVE